MASVYIELHVFSGRSNPTWQISESHPLYASIVQILRKRAPGTHSQLYKGLGYKGFTAKLKDLEHVIPKASEHKLERLLLYTKPSIPTSSHDHELITTHVLECLPRDVLQGTVKEVVRPSYDPERWNTAEVQPNNNCYNYANDKITNTIAQPGRAHGIADPNPFTADNISFLARKDGLIDVKANSPVDLPQTDQNLVALVIWPDEDYHWYRQDANNLFSHKPGRTEVRNVDNNGELIPDPRNANRFPYTIFYGFMGTTQDTVEIQ